jgi:F-type H+-transporting ATPase subunit a
LEKIVAVVFFIQERHRTFAADFENLFRDNDMAGLHKFCIALIFTGLSAYSYAQHDHHTQHDRPTDAPAHNEDHHGDCGHPIDQETPGEFNAGETAVHHIADANAIHVFGDFYINLPVILKSAEGWKLGTTAMFHPHHHGSGERAVSGYVLVHGNVMRIQNPKYHSGEFKVEGYTHQDIEVNGKTKTVYNAIINGECNRLDPKTTFDGGLMGGGITSFYDFSVTRNVFTMLLTCLLLFLVFRAAATSALRTQGHAPKGLQNFIEPFYTFIRDDVAKPSIGPKYEKYMPYLLSAFFFILGLNLIGQIPFFPGSANVTGNISVTIVLALITFVLMLFSSNKHFWEHTLWMPGVPAALKIFILTPVEILGLFLKPFTLLLRLFANITAGHIVILCFVGLIFIFGKAGTSVGGSIAGAAAAIPLSLFMMTLELLVAFLQAFIFTMLSATYIGMALEEPHH